MRPRRDPRGSQVAAMRPEAVSFTTARGALDVAKAKVPAEEMRIFDELRQNASA